MFRWGDPTRVDDLAIVALADARCVIVLADDAGDFNVVKAVLAAGVELGRFDVVPIVAEVGDLRTGQDLVRACGGMVYPFAPTQAVARISAYGLNGPGLIHVVEELLDFRGPNLYLIAPGEIVSATFGDTVVGLENARLIGLMLVDGSVELNPDRDTVIDASHRLIVIADDDSPPVRSSGSRRAIASPSRPPVAPQPAQHVLMIGWNRLGRHLLEELESTAPAGSAVEVVYDPQLIDEGNVDVSFCRRLAVRSTPSTSAMWHLGDDAESARLTSIVLLGYRNGSSPGDADSRTLLNLLAIKRELRERGLAPRVVVQLLDVDSADLAPPTGPDDFVISDAIGSRLIAQLADQPDRRSVLLRLYSGDGSAIQLVDPAALGLTTEADFGEVVDAAYSLGLLAIGWRRADERGGGITLNPHGGQRMLIEPEDRIVVID